MQFPFTSAIKTHHGTYLAPLEAEDGLLTQREEPYTWTIHEDGIQSADGLWLCAEEGGGGALRANRPEQYAWEQFKLVQVGPMLWTFRTVGGSYVRAVDTGEVLADAADSGAWETFVLAGTPQQKHPRPLGGRLTCNGRQFMVNGSTVLPVALHAGDLFSHAAHQGLQSAIDLVLDPAEKAGYQIIRLWFSLSNKGNKAFWGGREFSPWMQGWELWYYTIRDVLTACAERGLQLHLAGGDAEDLSYDERTQLYNELGRLVAEAEYDLGKPVVALFEVLNECSQTGLDDPAELMRLRDVFSHHCPNVLTTLSAVAGTEDPAVLVDYTPHSQPYVQVHTTRSGTVGDCTRHAFSGKYDGYALKLGKSLVWSTEPPGPGPRVSEMSGQLRQDLKDRGAMLLLAGAQTLTGIYTMFCSDGVIIDACIDRWAGFYEIPALVEELEALVPDIHLARLTHVGDYKTDRVVDLPNNDPKIRVDQYILDRQRTAVLVVYREDAEDGRDTSVRLDSLVGYADWTILGPNGQTIRAADAYIVTFRYGGFIVLRW